MNNEKERLLEKGIVHVNTWCIANNIREPIIHIEQGSPKVASCAYYRRRGDDGHIWIYPSACAARGRAGRQWSWPGYIVDRTPFGVLCHELGHHVDQTDYSVVPPRGTLSRWFARETHEPPITSYAPNNSECFAEMFRLFVTNPTLLCQIRPKTYDLMHARWSHVEHRDWFKILRWSDRHLRAAQNKINQAQRRYA